MRTLVIGDLHGGLKALEQLLQRAAVSPSDQLIFLGDYVDGWSESPELISLLMELQNRQNCVFLRGNHDALLLEYMQTGVNNPLWLQHGGQSTLTAYAERGREVWGAHQRFLEGLKDYYLDSQQRLFIHAGFTNLKGVSFEYFRPMLYWDRSLWETALATPESLPKTHPHYPARLRLYTEIYLGHTPTTRIGCTQPLKRHRVWNLDTGAGFGYPASIMDIHSKEVWQSEPLRDLYPNETGRSV